ncbi:feruloyl-CoA synthase [Henriciella mobilis]|uniref:feruloyl-CoA synthase n=1 Tax=Henriciella mobilis TaxID=2305467 RepID=UPI000E670505|nr:feruloyl-CoA synthase [Henriciella mobilis]RIJ14907.1 feruloyl-CoA synthase [Henriciella mobilis]RIJ21862.1 feruloyl-CoA synthase [Henriciella mobilis]
MSSEIPFREVPYLPQRLVVEHRDDGCILLRNGQPKRPHPPHMLAPLVYWASARPDQVFLAQRDPETPSKPGWVTITYGEALARVRALAQGFLDSGAGPDRPVMILSRNAIENALVMYAAMWAGSPVVPVTPAYATLSEDFARLKHIDRLTTPAIIYVEDGAEYQRGLDGIGVGDRLVLYRKSRPGGVTSQSLEDFASPPTSAVDLAYDRLAPDMVAKYMLTSGSTGEPKAVINTHLNVASMVKMIRSVWDVERLEEISQGPQVMISFLPWSHTYGAHSILHSMLDWGGTLYIDWGGPTPARLPEMLRNLKEIAPTQHTTVPAAWAAIATELEQDRELAKTFFSRILVMAYGGASMGQDIYERIQKVAVEVTGERISLSAGYGATETSPTISNVHWPSDTMGLIGLPLPGCEFKLAPVGEKMECRVRGEGITQGYFRDPDKTAEAFDEEGFYKLGDAVKFKDPENPDKGLAFDGRIAEEFKLASGTWVSAGTVRVKAVEAVNGALSDVVVCGLNQDEIALLGFLNEGWCRRKTGRNVGLAELAEDETVRGAVKDGLMAYNRANPNSAKRIARILLEKDQPKPDAGEITEKGYINQGRVQALREGDVKRLYSRPYDDEIIEIK